jgi:hypothetical protein
MHFLQISTQIVYSDDKKGLRFSDWAEFDLSQENLDELAQAVMY